MMQAPQMETTVNKAIVKALVEKTQPTDTVKMKGPIPLLIAFGVLFNGRLLIIQTGETQ